jgi:hypothetical protein
LLVEGPSELKTVQQFLRLPHQDHKVLLLPLGGSSLINARAEHSLEEIKRITPHVCALLDSERENQGDKLAPDRQAFVDICKKANIPCHVLERRATENYFPDAAVKKVLGDKYRALSPYERLDKTEFGWAKSDNWRIAREMSQADLAVTDLGEFLSDNFPPTS